MAIKIADVRLVASHPEVYEPCDDSFALVDALLSDRPNLLEHKPALCFEIGCGSGYVITSLALILGNDSNGIHYFATDINPHAIEVTSETLRIHGVHAEVLNMDIASGLENRLFGLVDVLVVNPPYVPTPENEVGCGGIVAHGLEVKMEEVLLTGFCQLQIIFCLIRVGCTWLRSLIINPMSYVN